MTKKFKLNEVDGIPLHKNAYVYSDNTIQTDLYGNKLTEYVFRWNWVESNYYKEDNAVCSFVGFNCIKCPKLESF